MSEFGPLEATDISEFLIPGSLKFGSVEPRTDEQIAGDQLLGEVIGTRYEATMQHFHYDRDPDSDVWDQVFGDGASLVWVYIGSQCVGSLQQVDGKWVPFPLTLVWEGDQA